MANYIAKKIDIFRAIFWYSKSKETMIDLLAFSLEQVKSIIAQNEKGIKPDINNYIAKETIPQTTSIDFTSELNNESADRFEKKKKQKKKQKKFGNKN